MILCMQHLRSFFEMPGLFAYFVRNLMPVLVPRLEIKFGT